MCIFEQCTPVLWFGLCKVLIALVVYSLSLMYYIPIYAQTTLYLPILQCGWDIFWVVSSLRKLQNNVAITWIYPIWRAHILLEHIPRTELLGHKICMFLHLEGRVKVLSKVFASVCTCCQKRMRIPVALQPHYSMWSDFLKNSLSICWYIIVLNC